MCLIIVESGEAFPFLHPCEHSMESLSVASRPVNNGFWIFWFLVKEKPDCRSSG